MSVLFVCLDNAYKQVGKCLGYQNDKVDLLWLMARVAVKRDKFKALYFSCWVRFPRSYNIDVSTPSPMKVYAKFTA